MVPNMSDLRSDKMQAAYECLQRHRLHHVQRLYFPRVASSHDEFGMKGTTCLDAFEDVDHVPRGNAKGVQTGNDFAQ